MNLSSPLRSSAKWPVSMTISPDLVPRTEQDIDPLELFVASFLEQLLQDCDPRVATVADTVFLLTRPTRYRRGSVEAAVADRLLELVIPRVTRGTRVVLPREDLVDAQHQWGISDRVTHGS
jgi:hypothetical protein